jgi:hypothetical protein
MGIDIIDVDYAEGLLWKPAIEDHASAGQRLLAGFQRQVEKEIGPTKRALLSRGVGVAHSLLGGAFDDEISAIAAALEVRERDVLLANLAYDLVNGVGCSTFAAPSQRGMIHARNLDWPFPGKLLRSHTAVFRTAGVPVGDFAMVGWPGLFGALTGMATGRFSVTVNYVVHRDESNPASALDRALRGYWPVSWLVRRALEECRDYKAAVRLLSNEPTLSSVLFTVVGTRKGEAVVIERGPDDYVHRSLEDGRLRTTNHYVTEPNEGLNADLSESDTLERFARLGELLEDTPSWTDKAALDALCDDVLASDITQHQVVMFPSTGKMLVAVPLGDLKRLDVEQRDLEVECPVHREMVELEDGLGEYECHLCGGDIVVDEDGVAHAEMLLVKCPADGKRAAVAAEDGTSKCDCGGEIEVEDGAGTHS